jgi:hypothetical protein
MTGSSSMRGHDVHGVISALDGLYVRDQADTLRFPHVVHVFDAVLGLTTIIGPFDCPACAATFADRYVEDVTVGCPAGEGLRVTVLPLEPVES